MKFKLNKQATIAVSIAMALSGSLYSAGSSAAGFEVTAHSAEGLGRAYAGEGAVTDNASALARNPAAAIEVPNKSLSLSGVYVKPDIEFRGEGNSDLDADDIADEAVSPGIYYAQQVDMPYVGKVGFGFSVKSDYGNNTRYHDNYGLASAPTAGAVAGRTQLTTVNYGLHSAVALTEKLSAGIGIHVVTADAELDRYAGGNNVVGFDGDDTDVTWSAGMIYKAAPGHQYSLAYRAKTDLSLHGKGFLGTTANRFDAKSNIDLPEILEFAGTNKLTDQTSLQYSLSLTRWDRFDSLIGVNRDTGDIYFGSEDNQDRKNSRRYSIGLTHDVSPKLTARVGFAFDEEAQRSSNRHLSSPDADRYWYTAGMSYKVSDKSSVDFAIGYIDLDDVTVDEPLPASVGGGTTGRIDQEASAIIVGAQYNQRF